ncbi:MAG: protein-disulfide reductase DsbD domain-containing protein [Paracoccaceae bacterium]
MIARRLLASAALCLLAATAQAGPADEVIDARILPGWRLADGTHMAGLRLVMAPGWKTYWRAPGDAGIPPRFDWNGSDNLQGVEVEWPAPEVFDQNGMRAIVYSGEVILPLRVTPASGEAVRLEARIELGVCRDICIPVEVGITGTLPAEDASPDPRIAAALAARPYSAAEAGIRGVSCRMTPVEGGIRVSATVEMPRAEQVEAAVIETADPHVWVSQPKLDRSGGRITASSRLMHVDGTAFALDRAGLRITVLGGGPAVDIQGCPAP